MSRRTVIIILLLIMIAGIGLRSYQLTARSLWFDEAFSWRLIQFPYSEMIARDATDVHPPLYYILLKTWSVVFASSLLSLRLFSVFFAGLTILAAYLFVSYAFRSPPVGLLAAALLALSGWQIQFAWEARMYTLGTALLLLSSWQLLMALRRRSWLNWLIYALLASALSYVHYYSFFSIAAQFIFIAGYLLTVTKGRIGEIIQSRLTWQAFSSFLLLITLFLPWLPTFLAQNSQVQQSYWIPGIGGWSIPDTFYRMFIPTSGIPPHIGSGWILISLLPIIGTVLGLILLVFVFSRPSFVSPPVADAAWLIFCSATIPFFLSIALSFIGQSLYQDRFFVFAHLFIVITLAVLLSRIPLRGIRVTAIVTVMIGFTLAFFSFWQQLDIPHKPGAKAAAASLVDQLKPGDQIIVSSPFVYFSVLHYLQENYSSLNTKPKLYSESGRLAHFAGGPILTKNDIIGPKVFSDHNQLWIVDTTGFGATLLLPPVNWHRTYTSSFSEVFSYQGTVTINRYIKN